MTPLNLRRSEEQEEVRGLDELKDFVTAQKILAAELEAEKNDPTEVDKSE